MSWFDTSAWTPGLTTLANTAKTALKQAQKNIDKVLEIPIEQKKEDAKDAEPNSISDTKSLIQNESENFFNVFGVSDPPSTASDSVNIKSWSSSNSIKDDRSVHLLSIPESPRKNASSTSLPHLEFNGSFPKTGDSNFVPVDLMAVEDLDTNSAQIHLTSSNNDFDLSSIKDSAEEEASERIPRGRLEIVFQDDEGPIEERPEEETRIVHPALDQIPPTEDFEEVKLIAENGHSEATFSPSLDSTDVHDTHATLNTANSPIASEPLVEKSMETEEVDVQRPDSGPDVNEELLKKISDLQELLTFRETKLMDMSRENARLKEENDNLSSKVSELAVVRDEKDVAEMKLQIALDDKKSLSEQLQLLKTELSSSLKNKSDTSATQLKDLHNAVAEKESIIKELMEEGEKLSKQQLQSSNHIKKLKSKQKELESETTTLRTDLEQKSQEIANLKQTLTVAEETCQKQAAVVIQLNSTVDTLEKDLLAARNQADECKTKSSTLQAALDAAYKELADLHREKAIQDNLNQEARFSAELTAKDETIQSLEKQKAELVLSERALLDRAESLQGALTRTENTLRRKETAFKEELADYQQRIQEALSRNEELSQNLAQATRPLLRQNEALQRQMAEQNAAFSKLEESLNKRLQDAMARLAAAQEKERFAVERLAALNGRIEGLETQIANLRDERHALNVEIDSERRKTRASDEEMSMLKLEVQQLKSAATAQMAAFLKEKADISHQLALEKEQLEMERRKNVVLSGQVADFQKNLQKSASASIIENGTLQRSESVHSTASTLDGRWSPSASVYANTSLYEVLRGGTTSVLDSLQSQLNMKEGEINHLRQELKQVETSRQKMSEELIRTAERLNGMDELKNRLDALQLEKEELYKRYNAMLQMYGEKVEQLEELRMDYDDIKALYKAQIDTLTKQRETR